MAAPKKKIAKIFFVILGLDKTMSVLGRRMSIQKILIKQILLHPSWNYIIFT